MTSNLSFENNKVQREQCCYDFAEIMRIGVVSVIFVNQWFFGGFFDHYIYLRSLKR